MSDISIVTAISPINVGIIKYFDNPASKNLYPINDYVTVTLDPRIVCAKSSVCARREFTEDEFWLNGNRSATQFALCLNEVKYRAATQKTVNIEFLTRKVHVACENNFLPSSGSSSFAAGFISLMTALCKLYNVRPGSIRNGALFPGGVNCRLGGFVQRREVYTTRQNYKGKLIAAGKHWPELRVLILVVKIPRKQTSTERLRGVIKPSEYISYRTSNSLPSNMTKITNAIKERNFALFAETAMKDNNQYHAINIDTYPPRAYKTEVSHKIAEVVHVFNKMSQEIKVGYVFDTGPNPTLFFLNKDAQEIISLIKYSFPSSDPDFIEGLNVPTELDVGHFIGFPIDRTKRDQIKYAIYTKVSDVSVEFETENHLLDQNGDLINTTPLSSPSRATITSSEYSDAFSQEDIDF